MEPKRLRNILYFLFFIVLILFGARFAYDFFQNRRLQKDDLEKITQIEKQQIVAEEAAEKPEPELEIVDEPEPEQEVIVEEVIPEEVEAEEIRRYITGEHTVKKGESFSLITGYYWEDIFLWPDLYIRNDMRSDDPDMIYPDEIIKIYNRLGIGNTFSGQDTEEILEAYLQVYRVYKNLGEKKNNSVWSLLWCAAKYDHDFLDNYKDRIDPDDRAMAQKYINEEGFLD